MDSCSEDPKYEERKTENIDMPEDSDSDVVFLKTVVWSAAPAEELPTTVQCGQYHDPLGDQCPAQPSQDQMPYPDYLMYPQSQQFTLLNSSITGTGNSEQSGMTSGFTTEPILCSMMPMLYNENQNGHILSLNFEPGPMFVTLENAPMAGNNSFCQEEVVPTFPLDCGVDPDLELPYAGQNASNNYTDFHVVSHYNQVACPSDSGEPTANSHYQASESHYSASFYDNVTFRTSRASRTYKTCHCTRSKCLKLYCECFASGAMCNSCNCTNCHNNPEHEDKRGKAIKSCLVRKPDAFLPKISGGKSGDIKGWHSKGCNCKHSGCLKNYCECYKAIIRCTASCKCIGCRNYDADQPHNKNDKGSGSASVITPAVMEAVVGRLLAHAEEAEREQRCEASAQHMVLSEFGLCLTHIVKAMFKVHTQ